MKRISESLPKEIQINLSTLEEQACKTTTQKPVQRANQNLSRNQRVKQEVRSQVWDREDPKEEDFSSEKSTEEK